MKERSCFSCGFFAYCWLRVEIDNSIMGRGWLNIDTEDAPAKYTDVFETLGKACLHYKPKQKKQ